VLEKNSKSLQLAGVLERAGADFSDAIPNFWVVILTDGADTSSKTSLKDACDLLAKIDAELGSLNLVKILLIGVELEGEALRNMEQLARAGGSSTVYENLRDTQSIRSKFHEISLQIRASASAAGSSGGAGAGLRGLLEIDSDDEDSDWPGDIQKGSRVRVVKSTHGFAGIQVGDVGVVGSRDNDGDYRVNFPKKDGWCAAPSDVVLDPVAELVRPGQRVRVKRSVTSPASGWGPVTHNMVGLALAVSYDGKVKTEFGFQSFMTFMLSELEPVMDGSGHWSLPFQCGQAVRVKPAIAAGDGPSTGWGNIQQGDIGYAVEWRDGTLGPQTNVAKVHFPRQDGWKGKPAELEVHAAADRIRPGATVRVQAGVDEPKGGWGTGVTHASVGLVRSVRHDGVAVVRFPTHRSWKGQLRELEVVTPAPGAAATKPTATAPAPAPAPAPSASRVTPVADIPLPAPVKLPAASPAAAAAIPSGVPLAPTPEQQAQQVCATLARCLHWAYSKPAHVLVVACVEIRLLWCA
jgi:hypothetical protein